MQWSIAADIYVLIKRSRPSFVEDKLKKQLGGVWRPNEEEVKMVYLLASSVALRLLVR